MGAVTRSPTEARAGYLGFVAHEFRNPVATALWCAELLGRISPEERAGARGAKLVALALRSVRRISSLVEDHLLAERLRAEGIPLKIEAVALREAAAEAGERAAPPGGLSLAVADGTMVQADRALLGMLLEALVGAAGREGAAVRVEALARDGALRLAVRGAPQQPDALDLPRKGTVSAGSPRPLGLVMAAAAAAALGLHLRAEGDLLELAWPAAAARESPGTPHP